MWQGSTYKLRDLRNSSFEPDDVLRVGTLDTMMAGLSIKTQLGYNRTVVLALSDHPSKTVAQSEQRVPATTTRAVST